MYNTKLLSYTYKVFETLLIYYKFEQYNSILLSWVFI